jgi:hypothetical protein
LKENQIEVLKNEVNISKNELENASKMIHSLEEESDKKSLQIKK